jgi:hypothetical protein
LACLAALRARHTASSIAWRREVQDLREQDTRLVGYDSYGREIAWGTCAACSYTKSAEVADFEGRDEAIDEAINDPNR